MNKKNKANLHGWLIIDKPIGITSSQAVSIVRRALNVRKIGHAGTLDPLATGILPMAIGEATKTMPYLEDADKTYQFTVKFGEATDTDDREGKIIHTSDIIPTKKAILDTLPSFLGEIEQTPPIYSAIKVDGQRAYALARKGEVPEMKPRKVTIHGLKLLDSPSQDSATLEMACSKGTYVRSLARDLALKLGTYGHVSMLRRTKVQHFGEKDAILLEKSDDKQGDLGHTARLSEAILPVEAALDDILVLPISPDSSEDLRQGRSIMLADNSIGKKGLLVCAMENQKLVAICKEDEGTLKPLRVFNY